MPSTATLACVPHDIIIPYGKGYEGATRISGGAYGYKLLVLLNIQEDCELIVGYVLGGLHESEITMLRRLLQRMDQTLGRLREWLKILVMDRGYWGTDPRLPVRRRPARP